MKRILVTLLTAVGITGPFVAQLAAQSAPLAADVPFTFVVGNRTMPAGHYRVSRLSQGAPIYSLGDSKGSSVIANFTVNEQGKPQNPSLTFACYGNECVLAKITPPDSPTAYALSESSIQKCLPHTLGMASMVAIKLHAR